MRSSRVYVAAALSLSLLLAASLLGRTAQTKTLQEGNQKATVLFVVSAMQLPSASASSFLIFGGWCTVSPCESAYSFTGGAFRRFPRPAGLSGCVHTATTSCPASTHFFKVGTADSGVPMKTIRIKAVTSDK